MRQYEIRILDGRALRLALNSGYFSDFNAIRAAQTLRHPGQSAEVWREDECIYQEGARQAARA